MTESNSQATPALLAEIGKMGKKNKVDLAKIIDHWLVNDDVRLWNWLVQVYPTLQSDDKTWNIAAYGSLAMSTVLGYLLGKHNKSFDIGRLQKLAVEWLRCHVLVFNTLMWHKCDSSCHSDATPCNKGNNTHAFLISLSSYMNKNWQKPEAAQSMFTLAMHLGSNFAAQNVSLSFSNLPEDEIHIFMKAPAPLRGLVLSKLHSSQIERIGTVMNSTNETIACGQEVYTPADIKIYVNEMLSYCDAEDAQSIRHVLGIEPTIDELIEVCKVGNSELALSIIDAGVPENLEKHTDFSRILKALSTNQMSFEWIKVSAHIFNVVNDQVWLPPMIGIGIMASPFFVHDRATIFGKTKWTQAPKVKPHEVCSLMFDVGLVHFLEVRGVLSYWESLKHPPRFESPGWAESCQPCLQILASHGLLNNKIQ